MKKGYTIVVSDGKVFSSLVVSKDGIETQLGKADGLTISGCSKLNGSLTLIS